MRHYFKNAKVVSHYLKAVFRYSDDYFSTLTTKNTFPNTFKEQNSTMKTSVLVGSKIRKLRNEKEYSQEYMAQKLNISPATYSKWERGETDLTINQLEKVAKVFEVGVVELMDSGVAQIINLKDSHQNTVVNREAYVNYDTQLLAHVKEENAHLRVENARLIDIIANKRATE